MTRKSAKYSCMARTTSWSSASASRSRDDFLMMLLKSGHSQRPHSTIASKRSPTYIVFAVFWLSQLFNQVLYRFG